MFSINWDRRLETLIHLNQEALRGLSDTVQKFLEWLAKLSIHQKRRIDAINNGKQNRKSGFTTFGSSF
ncbi:MAG: hypothetical protein ACXWFA_05095 [Methylobacter sp.]